MIDIDAQEIMKLLPKGWRIEFGAKRMLKSFRNENTEPPYPKPVEIWMPTAKIFTETDDITPMEVVEASVETVGAAIDFVKDRVKIVEFL